MTEPDVRVEVIQFGDTRSGMTMLRATTHLPPAPDDERRRFRASHRYGKTRVTDTWLGPVTEYATAYGFRFGSWPCLEGRYFEVAWGKHRFDVWYGLPSYLVDGEGL